MADDQLNSIVNVEKTSKQINDLVAGLDVIIARMEKIIELSAKTGVDIKGATKLKELTDSTQKHNEVEKEAIRLAQQKEKLEAQIISLQTAEAKKIAELNEQKKLINEKAKLEAQTNAQLVGAYKALNAQHEINKRALKDMAAAGDTTSAAYKKLAKEVTEADAKLKKIDASTGEYRRNVGNYVSALSGFGGAAGKLGGIIDDVTQKMSASPWVIAISAITVAISKMVASLKSVDSASDELNATWSGMKATAEILTDRIANFTIGLAKWISGDFVEGATQLGKAFDNLDTSITRAAIAGERYYRAMDKIDESSTQFISKEAELRNEAAKLVYVYQDVNKPLAEREAALKKSFDNEKQINEFRKKKAEDVYRAELARAEGVTGISSKILDWIIKTDYETVQSRINTDARIKKAWDKLYGKDGELAKLLQESRAKILDTESELDESRKRAYSKYTGFIKSINDESKKQQDASDKLRLETSKKSLDELWKITAENIKKEDGWKLLNEKEQSELMLKRRKDFLDKEFKLTIDAVKAAQEALKEITGGTGGLTLQYLISGETYPGKAPKQMKKLDIGDPKLKEEPMSEAELLTAKMREDWIERLEITRDFVGQISNLISTIYSNQILEIDEAAAADEKEKQRELKAAGDNKKKQDEINEKYRQKEAQREQERKKALHDEAVYNKLIAATQVVINTAVNAMKQSSVALSIAYIALGAIELAAVLAQNIPSYFKGRKGGPAELAKVHPGELIVSNGVATMTPPTESLAYLPAGADVIPASQVKEMAGRFATNSIGRTKNEVTVNVNDRYGKEMLDEMRKKKSEPKIIELKDRVIYQEGNYRQVSMR